jgi:hypothetical protein
MKEAAQDEDKYCLFGPQQVSSTHPAKQSHVPGARMHLPLPPHSRAGSPTGPTGAGHRASDTGQSCRMHNTLRFAEFDVLVYPISGGNANKCQLSLHIHFSVQTKQLCQKMKSDECRLRSSQKAGCALCPATPPHHPPVGREHQPPAEPHPQHSVAPAPPPHTHHCHTAPHAAPAAHAAAGAR